MKYLLVLTIGLTLLSSCKKQESKKDITVLGHAGISVSSERAVYPPNSLKGLEYSMDVLGADGVELDVQMTSDSLLVLFHDEFLDDNTSGNGCVSEFTWEELKDVQYSPLHKLELLDEGLKAVFKRNKTVMLDIKHYDFCEEAYIDVEVFDQALNKVLIHFTDEEKNRIIINSRYKNVLNALSDTTIVKAYETDEIDHGIQLVKEEGADMLTLKLTKVSETTAAKLRANNITYCIFGVKVKSEINQSIKLKPDFIISDNVSRTQRILN